MVITGGRHEASVAVRTRYGLIMFRVLELLNGMRFHLRLKLGVYDSFVRTAILY